MVINHEKQWLVITPMKTGSCSLNRLLTTRQFGGCLFVEITHHNTTIPEQAADYRKFLAVRNPYARASGLYRYQFRDLWAPEPVAPFASFARHVLLDHESPWWAGYWSRYVDMCDEPFGVIRLEHWPEDLKQLEPTSPCTIPHENTDPRLEPWTDIYAREPDAIPLVREWAEADCERFGYPAEYHGG